MTKTLAQFGPSIQNAFVPKDFDAALTYWTKKMGVGPFFLMPHVRLDDQRYRGAPSDMDFDVCIGYWGDTQVELIRQHNDAPSIYKDWLHAAREGLHHTLQVVTDMDEARGVVAGLGGVVLQEGRIPGGGEVIYVDLGGGPGTIVELLKPGLDGRPFFDMMKNAAKNWDGSDPLRRLG